MRQLIKKKLSEIENEVKDLHPLIEIILSKIPNIIHVNYTHGPNEMGADFILTQSDEIFKNNFYIGVIVKKGAIKQTNLPDIEKQIQECEIPRLAEDGKNELNLTEIWIISNEAISKNSQTIINHKYRTRNIKFVPGSRLVEWIERYAPNYWLDIPLNVGEFLIKSREANLELEQKTSFLPINSKSLYVEQEFVRIESQKYERNKTHKKKQKHENIFDIIEKEDFTIIEGPMGVGKTRCIRKVIEYLTNSEIFAQKKILPFSISYKDLCEHYQSNVIKFIDTVKKENNLKLLNETCLVLVDGIDEKKQPLVDTVSDIQHISDQVSGNNNIKVLMTSRPISMAEYEAKLDLIASRYELTELSFRKVISFIENICTGINIKNRIIEDLKRSELFKILPHTPIAAILLAKLLNENLQDLPSNMTELYSKYIELSLGRWDIDKGLQSQKEFEALKSIVTDLAIFSMKNETFEISVDDAKNFFDNYLKQRNLGIDASDLFSKLLNRCDIVCHDQKKNTIFFKHKTFAEYFYGQHLTTKSNIDFSEEIFDLYWIYSYYFYIGILRDCSDVLREVIKIKPMDERLKIIKLVNLGNFLLAGYTTPYSTIKEGIRCAFIEATNYYYDIVDGRIDSPFSALPRMHVLALIRTVLKENYSFEFFNIAIGDILLEADSYKIDDTHKALLFFLLDIAHVETGGISLFDDLITKFGPSLPLEIQFAIGHESDSIGKKTDVIKKMEKKIKRALTGNRGLHEQIKIMYEKPIKFTKSS